MDKIVWKLKYVPTELTGLQILKPKMEYSLPGIQFNVTVPVRVYVAYQADIVSPLPNDFILTK